MIESSSDNVTVGNFVNNKYKDDILNYINHLNQINMKKNFH